MGGPCCKNEGCWTQVRDNRTICLSCEKALNPITEKRCRTCCEVKPVKMFTQTRCPENYRSSCIPCENKEKRFRYEAKKNAPAQPDSCEYCAFVTKKLVCDHLHGSTQFRAWLCHRCNTGFGAFDDSPRGMFLAARWLRTRERELKCRS